MHIYSVYTNTNIYVELIIYLSMKNLMLVLKGFIIGIAKIIPGVSGAIIAISFGLYEKLINIISKPLHIKLDDIKFLFFLFLGAALGISILCKSVKWCLDAYYLPTMLLFTGLIIGGMSEITSKINFKHKNWRLIIVFLLCFTILYYLINIKVGKQCLSMSNSIYFLMGTIESLTTIIPGISGTAIFMALGLYENVLNVYEGMANFNIEFTILLIFLSSFIITTILISKIITWLFKHKKEMAYTGVLGFMTSSLVIMLQNCFQHNFSLLELTCGIILFIVGLIITKKINNFFDKL